MSRHSDDLMIGPGGRGKIPKSESQELLHVIGLLDAVESVSGTDQYRIQRAMEKLRDLARQVQAGYHRNPSESRLHVPFRIVDVLGRAVHEIAYKHKNGKLYKHDFDGSDAQVLAVIRNGKRELLISSTDGSPLWDEF